MSAGTVTQGHRRQQSEFGEGGPIEGANPGDYWYAGDTGNLWIRLPNGEVGLLRKTVHTITEHEDGTVTVSPSILLHPAADSPGWHGYLERGVWREV